MGWRVGFGGENLLPRLSRFLAGWFVLSKRIGHVNGFCSVAMKVWDVSLRESSQGAATTGLISSHILPPSVV
jgi:hypothetical protein